MLGGSFGWCAVVIRAAFLGPPFLFISYFRVGEAARLPPAPLVRSKKFDEAKAITRHEKIFSSSGKAIEVWEVC